MRFSLQKDEETDKRAKRYTRVKGRKGVVILQFDIFYTLILFSEFRYAFSL